MIGKLRSLGLSTYEARALHALLKKRHTLKELIRSARLPAGKAYTVAKALVEKGLAKASNSRPKELYVENASFVIKRLVDQHQAKNDSLILELQRFSSEIDNQGGKDSPFFDFGPSNEDNRRIQMRTFAEAEKEVLQILNIHHKPKSNRASKTIWEEEIEKAIARGVAFKCIYPVNARLPPILEKLSNKQPEKFQVKRLDLDYPRCDIIDGKKAMVKLVHEDPIAFGGIIFIENRKFAENLKSVFNKFWKEAE